MKKYFFEMHGWRKMETVRGKASVNECSRCGARPVISESHLGLFTINCPRCLICWDDPCVPIGVSSQNLYEAIKTWNSMNKKKPVHECDQIDALLYAVERMKKEGE